MTPNATTKDTFDGRRNRSQTASLRDWTPGDTDPRTNYCQCGNSVSQTFARVWGDEDGQVHRCLGCATARQLYNGAGAGKETEEARSQSPAVGGGKR